MGNFAKRIKMKILLLLISVCAAQWSSVAPDAPPLYSAGPSAHPDDGIEPSMWCHSDGSKYLLDAMGFMWRFETERGWIWQPDVPLAPRSNSAYWAMRDRFYVYGGNNQLATYGDLWVYDPKSRLLREVIIAGGPPALSGSAFFSHPASNRLYLWGGFDNSSQPTSALWAFDVNAVQWSLINTQNPPEPNGNVSATLGYSESIVYLYTKDQLWQLDLTSFSWSLSPTSNKPPPPGPSRTNFALWQRDDKVYLFGGISGSKIYGDTWVYSKSSWSQTSMSGSAPSARFGTAQCSDTHHTFVFGGDLWQFGPISVRDIVDMVQMKLDSATLFSFITMVILIVISVGAAFVALVNCVQKCRKRRMRGPLKVPMADDL